MYSGRRQDVWKLGKNPFEDQLVPFSLVCSSSKYLTKRFNAKLSMHKFDSKYSTSTTIRLHITPQRNRCHHRYFRRFLALSPRCPEVLIQVVLSGKVRRFVSTSIQHVQSPPDTGFRTTSDSTIMKALLVALCRLDRLHACPESWSEPADVKCARICPFTFCPWQEQDSIRREYPPVGRRIFSCLSYESYEKFLLLDQRH